MPEPIPTNRNVSETFPARPEAVAPRPQVEVPQRYAPAVPAARRPQRWVSSLIDEDACGLGIMLLLLHVGLGSYYLYLGRNLVVNNYDSQTALQMMHVLELLRPVAVALIPSLLIIRHRAKSVRELSDETAVRMYVFLGSTVGLATSLIVGSTWCLLFIQNSLVDQQLLPGVVSFTFILWIGYLFVVLGAAANSIKFGFSVVRGLVSPVLTRT